MWQLARTPRWIGALVLCLAIAAAFAALGQWQLSRAVDRAVVDGRQTEKTVPLESIAVVNATNTTDAAGQKVRVSGILTRGDYVIIGERLNQGEPGYWVMGHLVTTTDTPPGVMVDPGPDLAVALGWSPTRAGAEAVIRTLDRPLDQPDSLVAIMDGLSTYSGRYLTTEAPTEDDVDNGEQKAASVAALINQWADAPAAGVYGGYLVLDEPVDGLEAIDSPVPTSEVTLNWLNIFYAVEWAVFAVFAVFLWFRLVKDAWEREEEEREEEAAEAAARAHVN